MGSVETTQLCRYGTGAPRDSMEANGYGWVPVALSLWALKCEFHINFTRHHILILLIFSNHIKIKQNQKNPTKNPTNQPTLSSRAREKQAAGGIWRTGSSLPTPNLGGQTTQPCSY